ncbi:hypothetical protein [Abyssisolibacter fermentans]|uniref:hypothetical protein n=1 Tax=Abyssisolibacter fermentans TaxID=1766203 RepID=UPI0008307D3F|nr:hypothetical protein [Abyssisolibacter fermentans]
MLKIYIDENVFNNAIAPYKRKNYVFTKLEAYLYILIAIEKQESFRTKIYTLSKEWNWSRNKVRKFLDDLVIDNKIIISKGTENNIQILANINNYKKLRDNKKDSQKDSTKDTKKDTLTTVNNSIYKDLRDSEKDSIKDNQKDIKKDSEINIDVSSINEILNM